MSKTQRLVECRACLSIINGKTIKKTSHNIFLPWSAPWSQFGSTIAVDLARISNVDITDDNDYPHMMCESCCTKLYNACEFIARVQKSNEILKEREKTTVTKSPVTSTSVGKEVEWPRPIQVEKSVNSDIYKGSFDIEIKQEVISDEDMPDFGHSSPAAVEAENKELWIPRPSKKKATNGAVKKAKISKDVQVYETEFLDSPLKDGPSDMELSLDIPLECMLCSKKLQSVSGLKAHVMAQHNYKSVKRKTNTAGSGVSQKKRANKYSCATCQRTFVTPTDLMVHETCHNKSVCYGCNQKFDSFDKLSKHRRRCKAAKTQIPRMRTMEDAMRLPPKAPLKCVSCDESFRDEYYMNIHNEIHHNSQAKSENKNVEVENKRKADTKLIVHEKVVTYVLDNDMKKSADDATVVKTDVTKEDRKEPGAKIVKETSNMVVGKSISLPVETSGNKEVRTSETETAQTNKDSKEHENEEVVKNLDLVKNNDSQGDINNEDVNHCDLNQLAESLGLIDHNTEGDATKVIVQIEGESLAAPHVDSVDSKIDGIHDRVNDIVNTKENKDEQSFKQSDEDLQKEEENVSNGRVLITDNSKIEQTENKLKINESVSADVKELENREKNQSTNVNDGSMNTEVESKAIESINSESINPVQIENTKDDLDMTLNQLVEKIANNIQDSNYSPMDTNIVNIFEENSKILENDDKLESNNTDISDIKSDIPVKEFEDTEKESDASLENNLNLQNNEEPEVITEEDTLQCTTTEDILIDKDIEKTTDIEKLLKVNVTVESNIEQMDIEESVLSNDETGEQNSKSDKIKTIDDDILPRTVYNIKTLNPDQINLTVESKNVYKELNEIITPSKIDEEILPTVMEHDV